MQCRLLFEMYQCLCPVISVIYLEQIADLIYPTDWIDCRYEGVLTLDSSDEELPFPLEAPVEQQREEDDDDVVILEEVICHSCTCPALFMAFIANSPVNI